jgi:hypothetical protein
MRSDECEHTGRDPDMNYLDDGGPAKPFKAGGKYIVIEYDHRNEDDRQRNEWQSAHDTVTLTYLDLAWEKLWLEELKHDVLVKFDLKVACERLTPHDVKRAIGKLPGGRWKDRYGR